MAAVNEPLMKKKSVFLCFHGHEVGRMRKNCPKRKRDGLVCFFCEQPGHVRSDCQERAAWLNRRGRAAAVLEKSISGSESSDPCLLTTTLAQQRTALPRMYVDMHSTGTERNDWNRLLQGRDGHWFDVTHTSLCARRGCRRHQEQGLR